MPQKTNQRLLCIGLVAAIFSSFCRGFVPQASLARTSSPVLPLNAWGNDEQDKAEIEEEARLKIFESRRGQIRSALKGAESLRTFRIKNGFVPELDEDGKPIKSDGKFALTATAFVVAAGAIALRIGGRAALISTLGLEFFTENQELQGQMNQVLEISDSMGLIEKGSLFCFAWTLVKVLCFDAGGVVLALSAGILFGGILQGAVASAFGATVGSSVAFAMAKLDTPVRKKALEIVDENPSLRGIEKVVAKDGLKAILTLRLAPVLPIPIGVYNYVYGVTNVPYFDFAGGIFLGSLKPYLLDSYLGYFGKSLVDGTAGDAGGIQDTLLLVALGFSVLIGVFASQLAGETWDSVLKEQETEKKALSEGDEDIDDGIVREFFGFEFPEWVVGFQLSLQMADERIDGLVLQEYDARVWNYTDSEGDNPIPREENPAFASNSPEILGSYKGIDYGASVCDGLVLSPALFKYSLTFADPLFDEEEFNKKRKSDSSSTDSPLRSSINSIMDMGSDGASLEVQKGEVLNILQRIRDKAVERLDAIDERLEKSSKS
jgi:uncharacterized membrane protein YdjX (TVP38/TMEM64 family)